MKMFRKVLSLALVLTMLATCAVSGLVTVRAEGAEKIIDSDPASSKGIFTANAGLSGTNLRIIRGTFDGTELAFDRTFTAYHGRQYTVERHFHKLTDLTFPSDDHAKHTGHHTSD